MSVIVTKGGQDPRRIEPDEILRETWLQEYIVANPQALPLSDLRDDLTFLIVARELPTASGPIDAVGLDDEGNFYVIETKLYRNPDKRRILAQVLDYGAALWKSHGDSRSFRYQLEEAARRTVATDLVERIGDVFKVEIEDAEGLLATAEKQVAEGRFRFVVLMDRLDDPLKDLISFINENSRFDVFGVELQFYRFDDYEVTIPKLYGAEARKGSEAGATSTRRRWNEATYFEDAERNLAPAHFASLRQLYDFAVGHADRVTWGNGTTVGSFNLKYDRIRPTKSLMTVYSNGRIDLNFAWLHEPGQALPQEAQRFSEFLDLEGWSLPADYVNAYVSLNVNIWALQVNKIIEALSLSLDLSADRAE